MLKALTVFFDPLDHPGVYVVREFQIDAGPEPVPLEIALIAKTMQEVREFRRDHHPEKAIWLRDPDDDPPVVETWF